MNRIIKLLFFITLLSISIVAQEREAELRDMKRKMITIENEIVKLEEELEAADRKLLNETKSIENIDKQISLLNQKIYLYKKEIKIKRKSIGNLKEQIGELQKKIGSLLSIFKRQITFAYKFQRGKQIDWILGSKTFNQALIRYEYFKKASAAERISYENLSKLKSELTDKEIQLQEDLDRLNNLMTSSEKEQRNLDSKRTSKSRLARKIRQDKDLLMQSIKQKRESYQELAELISSLKERKPTEQLKPEIKIEWEKLSGSFFKNKGILNWPATGKIMHAFGKYKNPELRTVMTNTGIDIQAHRDSPVRCVFSGIVSLITYLSGFGNTVIIDHNDNFYTVYAHLDQVWIKPGDFVEIGNTLGTVGETGSLEGPKLHFEVYGNNKPLNPIEWLKKK